MSQTDENCQEAKSQWTEKILQRMAVLHCILYITIKGRGVKSYMKSIGDRLGRQEKAKQRNLWDWIKSKMYRLVLL